MNIPRLVELSGLLTEKNNKGGLLVSEYDTAVHCDHELYGSGITVYYSSNAVGVVSYVDLAKKALSLDGLICSIKERMELIDCGVEGNAELELYELPLRISDKYSVLIAQSLCMQNQIMALKKGNENSCFCGYCKGNYFYDKSIEKNDYYDKI